ncbi:hypothetical protein RIF29_47180 [Crotalaria pallida]|uniref:Uncharacterized protein n=1 Tax=Crotalaria pallida TaxID=3830 RepID=A0AAN9HN63_CROPI
MFQFARLSLACPWIQQQFERLTYSGISGSTLFFNSPEHFVAYYALPHLWVPRHPEMRKGVVSDEMLRGVEKKRRSGDSRIGQPFELLLNPRAGKRQPGELKHLTHIDGKVWHLDVGSSPPGAVVGSKGWAVRPLKRYVSWVQNVVRQFGPYPVGALEH